VLDVEKREDMFDFRMLVLRIASVFAIFYASTEFLKEPENLDMLLSGSGEIWNEVFEWGQNKFLGIPDNSTMVQTKKSARQIFSEAFMEDENQFGSNRRIYDETDYSVDPTLKNEEEEQIPEPTVDLDEEEEEEVDLLDKLTSMEEEDPLEKLTSNEDL